MAFDSSQHQYVISPLRWGQIHTHTPNTQTNRANVITSHAKQDSIMRSDKMDCNSLKQTKRVRSGLLLWNSIWKRVRKEVKDSFMRDYEQYDEDDDDTLDNIPTCYDIPVDTKLHFYLRHQSQQQSANLTITLQGKPRCHLVRPVEPSKEEYAAGLSTMRKLRETNRGLREMIHIKQVLHRLQKNKNQDIILREMEWYKLKLLEKDLCGGKATAMPKRNLHNRTGETTTSRRPSYVQQTMVTTVQDREPLNDYCAILSH
ncbi:hypothetical protein NQZ79_g6796 [Umbelopsis isabellina]|nr:hypothetical protein NQZ79_g6796 [Umbelopsis isabellina]